MLFTMLNNVGNKTLFNAFYNNLEYVNKSRFDSEDCMIVYDPSNKCLPIISACSIHKLSYLFKM